MRTERVRLKDLEPSRRMQLVPQLFELFVDSSEGVDARHFERFFLPTEDTVLALFYAADDALVGCASATLRSVVCAGRTHHVFTGAAYMRRGVKGGGTAVSWFGLGQALRAKLRAPLVPVSIVTRARTAATYRLAASTAQRVYPSRHRETPPAVEALAFAIARACGLEMDRNHPWLVNSLAAAREPERLTRSESLRNDPDVGFYEAFTRGKRADQTLMIWVPLDAVNVCSSALRLAARAFTARRRKH